MVTLKDFTEHFKAVPKHSAKKHAHQHGNAAAHGHGHDKTLVRAHEGQHADDHAKAELRGQKLCMMGLICSFLIVICVRHSAHSGSNCVDGAKLCAKQ
jgi:hypothetical protein